MHIQALRLSLQLTTTRASTHPLATEATAWLCYDEGQMSVRFAACGARNEFNGLWRRPNHLCIHHSSNVTSGFVSLAAPSLKLPPPRRAARAPRPRAAPPLPLTALALLATGVPSAAAGRSARGTGGRLAGGRTGDAARTHISRQICDSTPTSKSRLHSHNTHDVESIARAVAV